MPAYVIADVTVTDPSQYQAYREMTDKAVATFGGRFLVRGGEPAPLEGSWNPKRVVVLEFPDMESLQAWYGSADYAPALALRQQIAISNLIAVEGYPAAAAPAK